MRSFRWYYFFITVWALFLVTHNKPSFKPGAYKYQLAIAAIFYNEAEYLKEWIEYHLLVGVEHFYLFNNESTDEFMSVLEPYIDQNLVMFIEWPTFIRPQPSKKYEWVISTQVPAYEHAIRLAKNNAKWLAMIDIDEFLVPTKASSVSEVLQAHGDAPGIQIRWHVFGTSHLQHLPPNTLLVEALRMIAKHDHTLNLNVVKTILKPRLYEHFSWPAHTCVYKNNQNSTPVDKSEIMLNHYISRTTEYFYGKKLRKMEMGIGIVLSPQMVEVWANVGNDLLDTERPIDRFIPALRQRMGFTLLNNTAVPVNLSEPADITEAAGIT